MEPRSLCANVAILTNVQIVARAIGFTSPPLDRITIVRPLCAGVHWHITEFCVASRMLRERCLPPLMQPTSSRSISGGIRIYVAQTARVDVILNIGASKESITVTANATMLKTESAEQSTTLAKELLDELPLNFGARGNIGSANIRNPFTFVTLVPGGNISAYSSIKLNG